MSECVNEKFLLNGNVIDSKQFDDKIIQSEFSFYEVIRIIDGKCLFLEDHLKRLHNSITLFNIHYRPDEDQIKAYIHSYLIFTRLTEGNIKIVIKYATHKNNNPQLFVYQVSHYYPSLKQYKEGVDIALIKGERTNPNSKFINMKIRGVVSQKLLNTHYFETLLVNSNNQITEGSKSNVFFIQSNKLITAPNEIVLQGVTRQHILNICDRNNFPLAFRPVSVNELKNFDAVFISGTSINILPVKGIEGLKFNTDDKLIQLLHQILNEDIASYLSQKN